MGWTSANKRFRESLLEFFTRRWYPDPERCRRRIVALAQVPTPGEVLAWMEPESLAVLIGDAVLKPRRRARVPPP